MSVREEFPIEDPNMRDHLREVSREINKDTSDLATLQALVAAHIAALIGEIKMYGKSTAPANFVLCNGASLLRAGTYADLFAIIGTTFGTADGTHFNVPDMRGIFPRGAGVNGTLDDAGGTGFTGVLGTYQNDKIQGHWHEKWYNVGITGAAGGSAISKTTAVVSNIHEPDGNKSVRAAISDGVNGAPRTGTETNPANLGLTFIIRYQ